METVTSLSMYPYPYSDKCSCGLGVVKNGICDHCGTDYRMKQCDECSTSYAKDWDKGGGCPACQGIIGFPTSYIGSEKWKERKQKEREEKHAKFLKAFSTYNFWEGVESLTPEMFLQFVEDWYHGQWVDGFAHEMVGTLLKYIFMERKK